MVNLIIRFSTLSYTGGESNKIFFHEEKQIMKRKILILFVLLIFLFFTFGCSPSISINKPPVITSTPVTTAKVGVEYSYNVFATDPNGDSLTYSLLAFPNGMTINSSTGLITWIPTNNQVREYEVEIEVSDGELSVTQVFTITVSL